MPNCRTLLCILPCATPHSRQVILPGLVFRFGMGFGSFLPMFMPLLIFHSVLQKGKFKNNIYNFFWIFMNFVLNAPAYRFLLVIFLVSFLVTGCMHTQSLGSNTLRIPEGKIKSMRLVYIQSNLKEQKTNSTESLKKFGYYEIPELLKSRAAMVFSLNGLKITELIIVEPNGLSPGFIPGGKNDKSDYTLVLQMVGGSTSVSSSVNIQLNQQADLYSKSSATPIWTGNFINLGGYSFLMTIKYDEENIDRMLVTVLKQMADDKIIAMPKGGIKAPAKGKQ